MNDEEKIRSKETKFTSLHKRSANQKGGGEGKSSPREALQAAAVEQLTFERKYLVWKNSNDDKLENDNDNLRNLNRVETKSLS